MSVRADAVRLLDLRRPRVSFSVDEAIVLLGVLRMAPVAPDEIARALSTRVVERVSGRVDEALHGYRPSPSTTGTDDALADAMTRFQEVVRSRDTVAADLVLDADFTLVLVHPAPATVTRPQWLAMLPDYVVHDHAVEEVAIHGDPADDDLVVVHHRDLMRATVLGADRSGPFVITDVWRRRDSGWKLWRRFSTPLEAGPMPG